MVTAELAVGLPVLLIVLGLLLSAISVASAQVRAQDAAREAARAVARDATGTAYRLVRQLAPGGALALTDDGATVTATVRVRAHLLATWLPGVTVSARAVAAVEPGVGSGVPP